MRRSPALKRACRRRIPKGLAEKDVAMTIYSRIRTGGHILVEQLALHGADRVFGVPGESFLAALDGMYESQQVRFINARHEGGGAMMADAYGKLTGRPGIAFATRGPGATNASAGVHVAFQDSTPLILLLGQVGRDMIEREAFQEIDYRQMFGPMTKWVAQIDDARRIPEFISRAFATALSVTAPVIMRSGFIDFGAIGNTGPNWLRPPVRWAMACPRPLPPSLCI